MGYDEFLKDKSIQTLRIEESIRIALSLIIIALNLTQIVLIARLKRKKTIYELFLMSLAIADFLLTFFNFIFSVMFLAEISVLFDYIVILYFVTITTSFLHLLAIAMDRFVAVYFPLNHKVSFTLSKTKKVIFGLWTLMILLVVVLIALKFEINDITELVFSGNILRPMIFLATAVYTVFYGLIALKLIKSRKLRGSLEQHSTEHISNSSRQNCKEVAGVIVCVLTTLVFIACSLPIAIELKKKLIPSYHATLLIMANAGMNSILFFFRSKIYASLIRLRSMNSKQIQSAKPNSMSNI